MSAIVPSTALFKDWTAALADWVEVTAAIIIAIAVVEAAIRAAWVFVKRDLQPEAKENLRLHLARWLAVSLEFELAADILRTAIAPTWDEIGKLAAIAAIRTLLNYFLEKEIERAAQVQGTRPTARNHLLQSAQPQRAVSSPVSSPRRVQPIHPIYRGRPIRRMTGDGSTSNPEGSRHEPNLR